MYVKIPFGLTNTGAIFQREMDIDFVDEKEIFILIYLHDIIMFSKTNEDHLFHLKIIFEKCRKFGISLNPKKYMFDPEEGNC